MKSLKGKVAVVTGAASGIGRELAVLLAREGCDLAISDVNEEGLTATAEMVEKTGRKVSTHLIDSSNRESMEAFPEEVINQHGRVNLVANNAGLTVVDNVLEGSIEDFESVMGVNFWGVVYGSKFFLPHLLKEDEGHIINISSVFGFMGVPSQAYYCSSKFAVRGFSDSLRLELVDTKVQVSCVHPGGIDTNIARSAVFRNIPEGDSPEEFMDRFSKMARTSPAKAAQVIVNGVKKDKRRILIGNDARLIDIVTRLFPVRYAGIMNKFFNRE